MVEKGKTRKATAKEKVVVPKEVDVKAGDKVKAEAGESTFGRSQRLFCIDMLILGLCEFRFSLFCASSAHEGSTGNKS